MELEGSTALITGGTGSFGSVASQRLLERGAEQVRIFSRDELKQEEMRKRFADGRLRFYLGDVRDRDAVEKAVEGTDVVFHAAALKQVPSCEFFPMQAVATNVTGTQNVVEASVAQKVPRVVCLGTDKGAYPINAMGMTKALMEKVAQAGARLTEGEVTTVATVRYGNVLGSRGSVIPLFMQQIREGGPITLTDPEMTRFLLPLGEAIELVLFALEHAVGGDLFIRKAPACTIGTLAAAMQELLPGEVTQKTIGVRHGEKLFETLATREELSRAEDLGAYYRIPMDDRGLNYELYFTEGDPDETCFEDYTSHSTRQLGVPEVKEVLSRLPTVRAHGESGMDPG